MLRRASLVLLLVAASVGTASAECAWVLWVKKPSGWEPWYGYKTLVDCDNAAWTNSAGKLLGSDEFACLPDTVDPRGPKGK